MVTLDMCILLNKGDFIKFATSLKKEALESLETILNKNLSYVVNRSMLESLEKSLVESYNSGIKRQGRGGGGAYVSLNTGKPHRFRLEFYEDDFNLEEVDSE